MDKSNIPSNEITKPKMKDVFLYLNTIENNNLHFAEGWTTKREHVKNTMNLYLKQKERNIFEDDQLNDLEDWFLDISRLFKGRSNIQYPLKNKVKSEAIYYDNTIILKECFNLFHRIYQYHSAYRLRTENDETLKETLYHISQDRSKILKKSNKFDKNSTNMRKDNKYRAFYMLLKRVLRLLSSNDYEFRAQYYINAISLYYYCFKWEKLLDENELGKDVIDCINEVTYYLMYNKISETRIKNSLMIVVYTFLTKRLYLKEKDALNLTNRLANDILYDIDNRLDYTKEELSKDIYVYKVFDYLPIFAYQNDNYKPHYTQEQEDKILQVMKKQSLLISKEFKQLDDKFFAETFKNLHIDYVKQELICLYSSKEE